MKTVYIPIPVSSGELPEIDLEEKADLSIDVFFIDCDNSKHIGFYNFTTKEWISYEDCYVAPKFWLKKEEVPELTEDEKQQWKQQRVSKILEEANGSWKDLVEDGFDLGIEYAKLASKVEVKWEENMK